MVQFEARLRHAATGKLSLSTLQKMGTFFELGKDKAAKGEGWSPAFISSGSLTPTAPTAIRLWETFTFLPYPLVAARTTDDITRSPLHLVRFSVVLVELVKSIPVHSLILSPPPTPLATSSSFSFHCAV